MKKYTILISIIAILLLITACGKKSDEQEAGNGNEIPTMIEVEVLLPESIEPDTEVKIEALVTQGDEEVTDANEVTFEVWMQGQEADHEMIEGKNDGSGLYSFTKTFDEEGHYYVVAHTTARQMHVMPRVEFTVGNPTHHDHDSHGGDSHQDHDSHEHEHESTLVMTLNNNDQIKANQETTLSTEIKQENKALTEAIVSFEVWEKNSDKHEYIDAEEVSAGVYEAKTTFPKAGHYNVQIHVKKDALHEHQLEELVVE